MLIGVTGFFRDRAAFDALDRLVLPSLMAPGAHSPRVWVAACSTGEETWSLGMLLADHAERRNLGHGWQVFASDIDAHAIGLARAGLYADAIAADIPLPQLQRYFTRDAARYKVRKLLRARTLFTQHNLLHAPAFSRLDLVSCRNVLIYLNQDLHRQLLQHFHFALNPEGYLMLGSTESADMAADLFEPVDAAHRIYRARPVQRTPRPLPALPAAASSTAAAASPGAKRRDRLFSFADIHQHKALELAAPSILLNADAHIVHVSEQAVGFLRQASSEPTRELAALVLPALRLALRAALFQARASGRLACTGPVRYDEGDGAHLVDIRVLPFHDQHAEGELMLVRFVAVSDMPAPPTPRRTAPCCASSKKNCPRPAGSCRTRWNRPKRPGTRCASTARKCRPLSTNCAPARPSRKRTGRNCCRPGSCSRPRTARCSTRRRPASRRTTTWPT